MILIASPESMKKAAKYLSENDDILRPVIKTFGLCTIEPHKNYYQELVESIIGQQLSVKAGAAIRKRFVDLFDGVFPEPSAILEKTIENLRTAGLSGAKAKYIQDIAVHVVNGTLDFAKIDSLSNAEVVSKLTEVKGVGEWTAHMFMMFCMGRLDVLPVGDLGIKNGITKLYGLSSLATPDQIREIAVKCSWHPYETVASWYIWQSLDNSPKML